MLNSERIEIRDQYTNLYSSRTSLRIQRFSAIDAGSYMCISSNAFGKANITIRVYGESESYPSFFPGIASRPFSGFVYFIVLWQWKVHKTKLKIWCQIAVFFFRSCRFEWYSTALKYWRIRASKLLLIKATIKSTNRASFLPAAAVVAVASLGRNVFGGIKD